MKAISTYLPTVPIHKSILARGLQEETELKVSFMTNNHLQCYDLLNCFPISTTRPGRIVHQSKVGTIYPQYTVVCGDHVVQSSASFHHGARFSYPSITSDVADMIHTICTDRLESAEILTVLTPGKIQLPYNEYPNPFYVQLPSTIDHGFFSDQGLLHPHESDSTHDYSHNGP